MQRTIFLMTLLPLLMLGVGCSPVKEETIQITVPVDPLVSAKGMLQQYVDGQPLTSEVTMFPELVANVRKTDAKRADILEKGLKDLQAAAPASRPAVAKKVLGELQ